MNKGIQLLVEKYRGEFRMENEGLYSKKDYQMAERKYIIFCINGYSLDVWNSLNPKRDKQQLASYILI